jgi:hypothetical protein
MSNEGKRPGIGRLWFGQRLFVINSFVARSIHGGKMNQSQFEIHAITSVIESQHDGAELAWHDAQPSPRLPVLTVAEADGLVRVKVDPRDGRLGRVEGDGDAVVAFRVIRRRLGPSLAMVALREGAFVNGLPALALSVLGAKDSLVLAPGCVAYVTERIRPFVGTPADELVGKKCPMCRLPVDGKTRVVACRCGAPYHAETAESHPDVAEADRLRCIEKVKACLSCGRPEVTVKEYLVWDPASL